MRSIEKITSVLKKEAKILKIATSQEALEVVDSGLAKTVASKVESKTNGANDKYAETQQLFFKKNQMPKPVAVHANCADNNIPHSPLRLGVR